MELHKHGAQKFELLPFCLALKGEKAIFICLTMLSSMVSLDDDEGDTNSGDGNEKDYENQVGEGEEGDDEEDDDTIKNFEGNKPKGSQHNS